MIFIVLGAYELCMVTLVLTLCKKYGIILLKSNKSKFDFI